MSSKRVRAILLSGIVLIALILGVSLILTYGNEQTTVGTLPETQSNAPTGITISTGGMSDDVLKDVTVGADNVQAVIATLKRQPNYSRSVTVENFYSGKSAAYTIAVSVRADSTAMKIDGAGTVKYIILTGGKLYIWFDGDKDYRIGAADALGADQKTSDEFQMILTYEDILNLEKNSILDTGFALFGGENCIYVKYETGTLKYNTTAYISVASGLLTGAEQFDGATPVYKMTTSGYNPADPGVDVFNLPDGKNALSAP